jgi:excisionase family DNA binding protein
MTAHAFSIDALIEAAAERAAAKTLERAEELMRPAPPTLLDTAGLARELGVSDVHIRKLVKAKKLPSLMVGDCRRYVLAEVISALKAQPGESEADQ